MKKIDLGKTQLSELHKILKYDSAEQLDNHRARLFPKGNTQDEVSTTSIFLASLSAIKEYREELLKQIGCAKISNQNAQLHVYTEIELDANSDRPDGLIVLTTGKKNPIIEWVAFIEVKVKDNPIEHDQIKKYAEIGRSVGILNIITISNFITTTPLESPVSLPFRNVSLFHWSWTYLKVTGSRLIRNDAVEDEDHVYILTELRKYFDTHKNLKDYKRMGSDWRASVNSIHDHEAGQKVKNDLLDSIVRSYQQEEKDISLQMTDKTDYYVQLVLSKKSRAEELEEMLQSTKVITSKFMINGDKKNTFLIDVDFIRQKVKCYTTMSIDKGKAQAQTTALVKKLESIAAPDDMLINAIYNRKKSNNTNASLSTLMKEREEKVTYSILDAKLGEEVVIFEIKSEDNLGRDFQSVSKFVEKLENIVERFIKQVICCK